MMNTNNKENYEDHLQIARGMTIRNIKIALQQRSALHSWAVRAYEQALKEKQPRTFYR